MSILSKYMILLLPGSRVCRGVQQRRTCRSSPPPQQRYTSAPSCSSSSTHPPAAWSGSSNSWPPVFGCWGVREASYRGTTGRSCGGPWLPCPEDPWYRSVCLRMSVRQSSLSSIGTHGQGWGVAWLQWVYKFKLQSSQMLLLSGFTWVWKHWNVLTWMFLN